MMLNRLVTFDESLKDQLYPRVLTFRAVALDDATVLHFTIQHPLGDANGETLYSALPLAVWDTC